MPGKKDEDVVAAAWLDIATCGVEVGQVWRHQVTDSLYDVVALSLDEARLVPLVTYRSQSKKYVWTRDLVVFLEITQHGVPRFSLVS